MATNDYFDELMGRKAQAAVTGKTMSPEDISAYAEGIIGGRTKAAYTGAQLGLEQQGLAMQKDALDTQKSIGKTQSVVSGVGALGQLGVGGSLAYKAYQGFNAGGAPTGGTGTQAAVTGPGTSMGMDSSASAADMVSSQFGAGEATAAYKGSTLAAQEATGYESTLAGDSFTTTSSSTLGAGGKGGAEAGAEQGAKAAAEVA